MQTRPGPHSACGLQAPFSATDPPSWQSVVPSLPTRHTPVPALVLPPQLDGFTGSQATRHTARFGIATPPVAFTCRQPPVPAIVHALPALLHGSWHVPNTQRRPFL